MRGEGKDEDGGEPLNEGGGGGGGGHLADYPDDYLIPGFMFAPFNVVSRPNGQMPPPAL